MMFIDISSDYRCFKWLVQLAYRIGLSLSFGYIIYAIFFTGSNRIADENMAELMAKYGDEYSSICIAFYQKASASSEVNSAVPPPRRPSADLSELFQQDEMPIVRYSYQNDATRSSHKRADYTISKAMLKSTALKLGDINYMGAGPFEMKTLIHKYESVVEKAKALVVGSDTQWVEAFLVHFMGVRLVTTLDYDQRVFEDRRLNWFQYKTYLESAIESRRTNTFDVAVSYLNLQHRGLGRFGEPLEPNADLYAMQMIHCLLRPGGVLFLSLPIGKDGSGHIVFNTERVYSQSRLQKLLENWSVLEEKRVENELNVLYVLTKV